MVINTGIAYQTLSQYLIEIKEAFQDFAEYSWIIAEIARINRDKNGNYWFELVEKNGNDIIAQSGAVLWEFNSKTIQNFVLSTGLNLQSGMKILFYGKAIFHEKHGFKISILQIDPTYTLGELALKRKEVIERLTKEGLIEKNKKLEIPIVIQRIAVVSSISAAGYEDFTRILMDNKYGFAFKIKLFDAFVQGQEAVSSIVAALNRAAENYEHFDIIVLIRGGGSVVDLQCFDEYDIAKTIALMPLPVFTGIGHTRDMTVADHVAHTSFKTPSDLAKFIIERALHFDSQIENYRKAILKKKEFILNLESNKLINLRERLNKTYQSTFGALQSKVTIMTGNLNKFVLKKLNSETERIFRLKNQFNLSTNKKIRSEIIKINITSKNLHLGSSNLITKSHFRVKTLISSIVERVKNTLAIEKINLERRYDKLILLSPENILRRGYSIAYHEGKILKDSSNVKVGSQIEVQLYRGKIFGKVIKREVDDGEPKLF